MPKEFTQETLNQLAEVLQISDATAVGILHSLIAQVLSRAEGFKQAYFEADNYSELASEALYGAAAKEDDLARVYTADTQELAATIERLQEERDEARRSVGRLIVMIAKQDSVVAVFMDELDAQALDWPEYEEIDYGVFEKYIARAQRAL